jgi:chemotaxis protein MotA
MAAAKSRPDLATIGGAVLAVAAIVGGLLLEKGEIKDIAQITAAIIVLGGTLGAVMIATPMETILGAMRRAKDAFSDREPAPKDLVDQLIRYATEARKNGLVSLEKACSSIDDPFLRKALTLAVDGTDLAELRHMMELEMTNEEQVAHAESKVFESAGGFAPTIGIIGAVMGLIQVMKNLANIEEVGHGIAVAFVATVYGVAFSNIFCLPMAAKLKARAEYRIHLAELKLEGVLGIAEGMNPTLLRARLEAFEHGTSGGGSGKSSKK